MDEWWLVFVPDPERWEPLPEEGVLGWGSVTCRPRWPRWGFSRAIRFLYGLISWSIPSCWNSYAPRNSTRWSGKLGGITHWISGCC